MPAKELQKYGPVMHNLGVEQIREIMKVFEEHEPMEDFIDILKAVLESVPSKLDEQLLYPLAKCAHCDEWISFRDDDEGILWLWQGKETVTMGIKPMSYCPFPYHTVTKILRSNPDWAPRLRSSCKVCGEEISFPTTHSCLIPVDFSL